MTAVVSGRLSVGHGTVTAIWSQRRTTFVAILRAIEIFSFAPVARNHNNKKANHFSAKRYCRANAS